MNNSTAFALMFAMMVSCTSFIISYHWLSRRTSSTFFRNSIQTHNKTYQRLDHNKNTEVKRPTNEKCESDMRLESLHTSSEYCESPCVKDVDVINMVRSSRIMYNDRYKFIYCPVPKAGMSNWRRVLLTLSDKLNITDPLDFKLNSVHAQYYYTLSYLNELSPDQIKHRLQHYYKFLFVRDPFERLLSTYKDKFVGKNRFAWSFAGKYIIRMYRQQPTVMALQTGLGVTFPEFIQYVVDTPIYSLEEHWQLITMLCFPCSIKYDFVGHLDNVDTDARTLLDKLGVSNLVRYPERSNDHKYPKTTTFLKEFYKTVPMKDLIKLKQIYKPDYLMFNLTVPPSLQEMLNNAEEVPG